MFFAVVEKKIHQISTYSTRPTTVHTIKNQLKKVGLLLWKKVVL